jgi:hypothetical protein
MTNERLFIEEEFINGKMDLPDMWHTVPAA